MSSEKGAKPYVIHGSGQDKCPSDSFCLFADIKYNTSGKQDSILVIPANATANNFSEHGFTHKDDGVSAVVNNTGKDNFLFTKTDQGGDRLSVPAGTSIADLTQKKLPSSPNGTWNDRAQSALAHNEPVPLPVITEPAADAQVQSRRQTVSGTVGASVGSVELFDNKIPIATCPVADGKWKYTPDSDWTIGQHDLSAVAMRGGTGSGRAYRRFYVTLPSPVVEIRSPKDGAKVDSAISIDGIAFNADTVDVAEGGTQLGSVPVANDRWSFSRAGGWTLGSHSVTAVSVRGGQKSDMAKVGFTVAKRNLTVKYKLRQEPWQDWETQKYIYPFSITLSAGETDVKRWRVGFGQLPSGTVLFKDFVNSFWGVITEDGSHGAVLLGSPAKGRYIVPARNSLNIDIQVLFPAKDETNKKLYGLFAEDWS
ncbi:hypothetical protein BGM19_04410 [Streptomyces agglomeratus]|uniref:hypothetical protein n=1 Tax=Streptomyces agglomeratus TaxID=285458 RepID=UPI00085252A4|nr:hypothetical protein [Streptomyces agglomeratus]OEJ57328.1 hypothetical protein BGM19_04410 [Streptomyces agglomeratus]